MENPVHLGDGAYATFTGVDYVVTANHHDPQMATDRVNLDANAIINLVEFVARCEQEMKQLRTAKETP